MTSNPDDKRHLIISADSEDDLRRLMRVIPGYQREELEESLKQMMLPDGEDRFYLRSGSGERIVICHEPGKAEAVTINVMEQDDLDHPVPLHQDEVVKLHKAIKGVDGLYSQVIAAEIDLFPPPTETRSDAQ